MNIYTWVTIKKIFRQGVFTYIGLDTSRRINWLTRLYSVSGMDHVVGGGGQSINHFHFHAHDEHSFMWTYAE
jgi:hypothetical protein